MKEIPLTQGQVALVDDEDFESLNRFKWHFQSQGYARRRHKGIVIMMHRAILDAPTGTDCDHINGNGLDNRRSNLRLCTRRQNNQNCRAHAGQKGGSIGRPPTSYKGVFYNGPRHSFDPVNRGGNRRVWGAKINVDGRSMYLGGFESEVEAAKAYDDAALRFHGAFARVNFPEDHKVLAPTG